MRVFIEFNMWLASLLMFSFGTRWGYFCARRAAWFVWTFMPRLRNTALRNVDMCLPELPQAERTRIARKSFDHVAYVFFEFVLIPKNLGGDKWKPVCTLDESLAPYFDFVKQGKAPLTAAAHHGSWEMGVHVNGMNGVKQAALYRPGDLPIVDRWMRALRAFSHVHSIEKEGGLREMLRCVKEGMPVLGLFDQYGGDNGYEYPFFGIPTRWQADLFKVFLRRGLKMCVCKTVREGDQFKFRYSLVAMRDFPEGTEIGEVVKFYADAIEKIIRDHPEQYFWLHRRFKDRRKGAKDRYKDGGKRVSAEERAELVA